MDNYKFWQRPAVPCNGEFFDRDSQNEGRSGFLDEWGNAEQAVLSRMIDCTFDFTLGHDGQIQVANIGESTQDRITKTCYPELDKALA